MITCGIDTHIRSTALLSAWLPNAADREQVLRTTPWRLCGFDAA